MRWHLDLSVQLAADEGLDPIAPLRFAAWACQSRSSGSKNSTQWDQRDNILLVC